MSPISCGVLLVGQKGRGSREDGKVGETDQNGSPKHTLKEREEKYGVETKKKTKNVPDGNEVH